MRRSVLILVAGALLASGFAFAPTALASSARHSLYESRSDHLVPGQRLTSTHGRYYALVQRNGRLVVHSASGRVVWRTAAHRGAHPHLTMGRGGQVVLVAGRRVRWSTRTSGSGNYDVLTMRNDGTLALTSRGMLVWSSRVGSACPRTRGKTVTIDLSQQRARACNNGQQLRVTPVTTGATARGDGTPRGSWRVRARVRNTTLRPASGGSYPARYWMPYHGAYGIHDSRWQTYPYGSSMYRTRGSHGCTHVPARMMRWLFGWARVGSRVTIHR